MAQGRVVAAASGASREEAQERAMAQLRERWGTSPPKRIRTSE